MGLFTVIDSIPHGQQWAHLMLSATFLMSNNGPIQCRRYVFSPMGSVNTTGNISLGQQWAPFHGIGNLYHKQQLAH
jgi:hypothetical protein